MSEEEENFKCIVCGGIASVRFAFPVPDAKMGEMRLDRADFCEEHNPLHEYGPSGQEDKDE